LTKEVEHVRAPEIAVLERLQAITKEIGLTYKLDDGDLGSHEPMNMDSLEFMSFLIEIQSRFGVKISDEEVQQKRLTVTKNLVAYLLNSQPAAGRSAGT